MIFLSHPVVDKIPSEIVKIYLRPLFTRYHISNKARKAKFFIIYYNIIVVVFQSG